MDITTKGNYVFDTKENREVYDLNDSDFRYEYDGEDYYKIPTDKIDSDKKYFALSNSCKGLKNNGIKDEGGKIIKDLYFVYLCNSSISLETYDDSINSNKGNIVIDGGAIEINSRDDAVTCDFVNYIRSGTLSIHAYEGIEGKYVEISGGVLNIFTEDDAINAGSGDSEKPLIFITGGKFDIHSTIGDAIDANGYIYITGGDFKLYTDLQEVLDSDGDIFIDGGNIIGVAAMQIAERTYNESQLSPVLLVRSNYGEESQIEVFKDDELIASTTTKPDCISRWLLFSYENVAIGDVVVIKTSGVECEVELTDIINISTFWIE